MKLEELAMKCVEQIDLVGSEARVMLKLPRQANGNTVRLLGRQGGPVGTVCQTGPGYTLALFRAQDLLRYLATAGVIVIRGQELRKACEG